MQMVKQEYLNKSNHDKRALSLLNKDFSNQIIIAEVYNLNYLEGTS